MTKICINCGKSFKTNYERKKLCSKKCYTDYNRKIMRERYWKKKAERIKTYGKYPSFRCPHCHTLMELDFNPRVQYQRWENFVCLACGLKRTMPVREETTEEVMFSFKYD